MRKDIDARLERWADWWGLHLDQSAIGYPTATVEGRAIDGALGGGHQPAHSISPEVLMPRSIAETDRTVMLMPRQWKSLIHKRYLDRTDTSLTKQQYCELDRIHYWAAGRLMICTP